MKDLRADRRAFGLVETTVWIPKGKSAEIREVGWSWCLAELQATGKTAAYNARRQESIKTDREARPILKKGNHLHLVGPVDFDDRVYEDKKKLEVIFQKEEPSLALSTLLKVIGLRRRKVGADVHYKGDVAWSLLTLNLKRCIEVEGGVTVTAKTGGGQIWNF